MHLNRGSLFNIVYYIKSFFFVIFFVSKYLASGIPESENRVMDYDVIIRVKSNCDVITNFSLIFRNLEFLMKIIFPSYVTLEFFLYLITLKFPSYSTNH